MFAGRQEISDSVEVFSTALYTKRKSYNLDGATTANQDSILDNPQISASAGLDWHVGGDWQIEAAGNYSRNNANQLGTRKTIELDSAAEVRQIQAKADGSLLGLPGGALRMAVGVEWRSESYRDESIRLPSGTVAARTDSDRTVRSAFGEIYVPVVGATNALPMVRSLDLSIAGRFDEYSNTGSSFDPQFGMMWEPVTGLRFRSSYGTSYVIPKLADFSATGNLTQAYVIQVPDPGSTTRTSRQMILRGIDVASLSPQESRSLSVGIEFTPEALRALRLSLNYYNINYKDRVSSLPAVSSILLGNPAAYGSLIAREPSIDLINQGIASGRQGQGFFVCSPVCVPEGSLAPESIDVIVDQRRRNLSEVKTRGFDISAQYGVQYLGNSFQFVLSSTYIDELSQRVTSSSAQVDSVDTVYNPPHWRARGSVGWVHDGWGANLFVNYTDSYEDIRVPASHKSVDSYTTVDARLAYDFSVPGRDGLRSGLSISLSAQNLFDQDPPQLALLSPGLEVGFDPTNANPMGRLLAIEINKVW
jgi:outer membrane receptor protein involved in Fe transport